MNCACTMPRKRVFGVARTCTRFGMHDERAILNPRMNFFACGYLVACVLISIPQDDIGDDHQASSVSSRQSTPDSSSLSSEPHLVTIVAAAAAATAAARQTPIELVHALGSARVIREPERERGIAECGGSFATTTHHAERRSPSRLCQCRGVSATAAAAE